ncbi:Uncharacterised protein [uncultured archaeon]|nr:Uncharacterised protein [uncultured archaeon]
MSKSLSEELAKPIPGNPLGSYIAFTSEELKRLLEPPKKELGPGEHYIPGNQMGSTYIAFPLEIFNQKP